MPANLTTADANRDLQQRAIAENVRLRTALQGLADMVAIAAATGRRLAIDEPWLVTAVEELSDEEDGKHG